MAVVVSVVTNPSYIHRVNASIGEMRNARSALLPTSRRAFVVHGLPLLVHGGWFARARPRRHTATLPSMAMASSSDRAAK